MRSTDIQTVPYGATISARPSIIGPSEASTLAPAQRERSGQMERYSHVVVNDVGQGGRLLDTRRVYHTWWSTPARSYVQRPVQASVAGAKKSRKKDRRSPRHTQRRRKT